MFNSVVHDNSAKLTAEKRRHQGDQPTVELVDDEPSLVANSVSGLPGLAQNFHNYNKSYKPRDAFTSDQQKLKGRGRIETMDVDDSCNMNPLSDEEQHVIPDDILTGDPKLGDPHK